MKKSFVVVHKKVSQKFAIIIIVICWSPWSLLSSLFFNFSLDIYILWSFN
jgi:hypothetical protein